MNHSNIRFFFHKLQHHVLKACYFPWGILSNILTPQRLRGCRIQFTDAVFAIGSDIPLSTQ